MAAGYCYCQACLATDEQVYEAWPNEGLGNTLQSHLKIRSN